MKRKLFVPIVITLVTILVVGLAFYGMQRYVADRNFDTIDHALESVIDLQASAVYNGYFAWTGLYDLIMEGKLAEANELAQDAKESFPLIDSLEIGQGIPPEENFVITLDGELLRIEYPIRNDDETKTAPNTFAVTVIQAQNLLDIVSPHEFRIDTVHGRKTIYGILSLRAFPSSAYGILLLCIADQLDRMVYFAAYFRKSDFFLDTRGLNRLYIFLSRQRKCRQPFEKCCNICALCREKSLDLKANG